MSKLIVTLSVVLALAVIGTNASAVPGLKPKNVKIKFSTPEQIKELLKQHPKAIELQRKVHKETSPETKDQANVAPHYIVEYFIGNRTPYDYRVAYDSDSYSWPQLRDVQMTIDYPSQGIGQIVTFVDIYVAQSSTLGRAYVIAGGVGYRYISIVIEAERTSFFEYDATIYGQN